MIDERQLIKNLIKNPAFENYFDDEFFNLDENQIEELKDFIFKIEEDNYENEKERGQALETLIRLFFEYSSPNLLTLKPGVRTSSNEIDILIILKQNGIDLNINKKLGFSNNEFLIEAKNYNKKVDVTWVGKFAHLMNSHNIEYGIIFSKHELTGIKNEKLTWTSAAGLTKKFYLKNSKLILNLTLNDLKKVLFENKDFLNILNEKKINIQLDTEIELIEHSNSKGLKKSTL